MAKKKSVAKTRAPKAAAKPAAPHILIVEARYYDAIADELLRGAVATLAEAGATHEVITVPGALEIPGAIAMAIDSAKAERTPYDGVVALGCVIQGETYHFDIVSNESARGLMDLTINRGLAIGNGILTVDNEAQARARLGGLHGHKGEGAAKAALSMITLKRSLSGK
ncbi:MAG: 6,7-dimethyl-8-ribityllumazine synthase [Pseudolabrys sp.]|jgi:6,7-dimethyl-8-ribityllumazine synthase